MCITGGIFWSCCACHRTFQERLALVVRLRCSLLSVNSQLSLPMGSSPCSFSNLCTCPKPVIPKRFCWIHGLGKGANPGVLQETDVSGQTRKALLVRAFGELQPSLSQWIYTLPFPWHCAASSVSCWTSFSMPGSTASCRVCTSSLFGLFPSDASLCKPTQLTFLEDPVVFQILELFRLPSPVARVGRCPPVRWGGCRGQISSSALCKAVLAEPV